MPFTPRRQFLVASMLAIVSLTSVRADDADIATKKLIEQVIGAIGGEEKLLKRFRFRERVLISSTPTPAPKPDEKGNRTSTIEVGGRMWIGTNPREKDKVRILIWAWSLGILTAPDAKVSVLKDAMIDKKPALALQVTGVVKEPIELFFDSESKLLIAIDYTDTRHSFSEWKKTDAGHSYPSHVVGHRFADRTQKTLNEKQWYQTDILELTPLAELPAELKNK